MANKIVEVLTEIERGRKNCIKNARLANFNIPDNTDFFSIGELFKYKNTEYSIPNDMWDLPEEWAQLRDAIETLPNITVGGKTYKPFYILILEASEDATVFSYTTTSHCLFGDLYVTSDGAQYVSNGADVTHTWDTTKDLYSDTFKVPYRYVTVYNEYDFSEIANTSNTKHIQLNQYKALAFIQKKNTSITHLNTTSCSFTATSCYSLLYVQICGWVKLPAASMFANAINLKRVDIYGACEYASNSWDSTYANCSQLEVIYGHDAVYAGAHNNSGYAPYRGCASLTHFIMPHLKRWGSNGYSTTSNQCPFTYFYAPELETIESKLELPNTKMLYFPNLKSINSSLRDVAIIANAAETARFDNLVSLNNSSYPGFAILQAASLKELYLPKLEALPTHSVILGASNLTITAPLLKTIYRFSNGVSYVNTVSNSKFGEVNSNITWNVPALTAVLSEYAFIGCGMPVVELKKDIAYPDNLDFGDKSILVVKLYEGWDKSIKLTGLGMYKSSLIDALNKLATVPSSANKTVTLGTNINKLTDSEKAIATNKGWTLA